MIAMSLLQYMELCQRSSYTKVVKSLKLLHQCLIAASSCASFGFISNDLSIVNASVYWYSISQVAPFSLWTIIESYFYLHTVAQSVRPILSVGSIFASFRRARSHRTPRAPRCTAILAVDTVCGLLRPFNRFLSAASNVWSLEKTKYAAL